MFHCAVNGNRLSAKFWLTNSLLQHGQQGKWVEQRASLMIMTTNSSARQQWSQSIHHSQWAVCV